MGMAGCQGGVGGAVGGWAPCVGEAEAAHHIAIMLSAAWMMPACSQLHVTIRHHSPCVHARKGKPTKGKKSTGRRRHVRARRWLDRSWRRADPAVTCARFRDSGSRFDLKVPLVTRFPSWIPGPYNKSLRVRVMAQAINLPQVGVTPFQLPLCSCWLPLVAAHGCLL